LHNRYNDILHFKGSIKEGPFLTRLKKNNNNNISLTGRTN